MSGGFGIDPALDLWASDERDIKALDLDRDGRLDLVVRVPAVDPALTTESMRLHVVARRVERQSLHGSDVVTVLD